MTTFATPIGKVRYSGNRRFVVAVATHSTKIGTTVVKRSDSASTAAAAASEYRTGSVVVIDTTTGKALS